MQQAESEIIIDNVIKEIARKYHFQDYFALTRHDSIYTTEDKADDVKRRMLNAFAKYSITPTIVLE